MAHRLDHFNRDKFIIRSGQITVIREKQLNASFQSLFADTLLSPIELGPGDGVRGHPAAVAGGRKQGEPTPARCRRELTGARLNGRTGTPFRTYRYF
jgi:hypothetical protein